MIYCNVWNSPKQSDSQSQEYYELIIFYGVFTLKVYVQAVQPVGQCFAYHGHCLHFFDSHLLQCYKSSITLFQFILQLANGPILFINRCLK